MQQLLGMNSKHNCNTGGLSFFSRIVHKVVHKALFFLISNHDDNPLSGMHNTEFTTFTITDSSVAGCETTRRASLAQNQKLADNVIQFSGSILVNNIRILEIINYEVKKKSYSVPFVAHKLPPTNCKLLAFFTIS